MQYQLYTIEINDINDLFVRKKGFYNKRPIFIKLRYVGADVKEALYCLIDRFKPGKTAVFSLDFAS